MKYLILVSAMLAPTFASAVYHQEAQRFLCIGEALSVLDVIEDGKETILINEQPSDFRFVVTKNGNDITITHFDDDSENRYTECSIRLESDFECHTVNGMGDMFYFSTESKRFLKFVNVYTTALNGSWEPFMVGGDCAEF